MSYVLRAVKSPDFWIAFALLSIIGATMAGSMYESRQRNEPGYDPCARYMDMPAAAATCYQNLVDIKEAKSRLK
jgi:hypothetical protein